MKTKKVDLHIKIDESLKEKLKELASNNSRDMTQQICWMIKIALNKEEQAI